MTHEFPDTSLEHKQQVYEQLHRASQALVNLIVLRDADYRHHDPNFDPDTLEGFVRSEVFRLQHEALQFDPAAELEPARAVSLGEAMITTHVTELAVPGRPITRERLIEVDTDLLHVMTRMEKEGIGWPADDHVFHDVLPEDFDDKVFGEKLVHGSRAYNNFPAILSSLPDRPGQEEPIFAFMQRNARFQYASKPYLARAHALVPEFMDALQTQMAKLHSPQEWRESLLRAVSEDDPDPEDQILLRASRLAYQLFINLMRKDDLHIQSQILTLSMKEDITDPIKELWT